MDQTSRTNASLKWDWVIESDVFSLLKQKWKYLYIQGSKLASDFELRSYFV